MLPLSICIFLFFFTDTAPTEIYTLSLHDALPISSCRVRRTSSRLGVGSPLGWLCSRITAAADSTMAGLNTSRGCTRRSEEHTSELQSHSDLVCRLLLEKKKKKNNIVIEKHSRHLA